VGKEIIGACMFREIRGAEFPKQLISSFLVVSGNPRSGVPETTDKFVVGDLSPISEPKE
jgi:hypothetical protein